MRCGAALVRPDSAHEVDARHVGVLIAFVDPDSELGAALSERITGNILRVSASEVARWRVSLGRSGTPREALVARWARNEFLHGKPVRDHAEDSQSTVNDRRNKYQTDSTHQARIW
jgi:hypothetical protein